MSKFYPLSYRAVSVTLINASAFGQQVVENDGHWSTFLVPSVSTQENFDLVLFLQVLSVVTEAVKRK